MQDANNPNMAVLIVHGWDELSSPFVASRLKGDQTPSFGMAERVQLDVYPWGHATIAVPRPNGIPKRSADKTAMTVRSETRTSASGPLIRELQPLAWFAAGSGMPAGLRSAPAHA